MKSTFAFKICSTLSSIFEILRKYGTNVLMDVDIYDFLCKSFNGSRLDIQEVSVNVLMGLVTKINPFLHDMKVYSLDSQLNIDTRPTSKVKAQILFTVHCTYS
jgi:hypothetical protein